jgi:HD-like signal output (HDOD) protein
MGVWVDVAQAGPSGGVFEEFAVLSYVLLVASALGLTGWLYIRRTAELSTARAPLENTAQDRHGPAAEPQPRPSIDAVNLGAVNASLAERLWKYSYSSTARTKSTQRMDDLVRGNVNAILQVDTLDHDYFPRRPTLMSELMRAIDNPDVEAAKLSRLISLDPVLTGEVLRLANSSLYRVSPAPIDTVQRAIAICGVDALRAMLAAAMLRPVFRANSKNFPRLPRALWSRTERAARAAELFALSTSPELRFESQMVVLVNAIGPLVVYSAVIDVYSRNSLFQPNPALCVALTSELAAHMAQRVAKDWEMSPRLIAALEKSGEEPLTRALYVGELLGTLSYLESQTVISERERSDLLDAAGLQSALVSPIWNVLQSKR